MSTFDELLEKVEAYNGDDPFAAAACDPFATENSTQCSSNKGGSTVCLS
jgi:hypothetical protein